MDIVCLSCSAKLQVPDERLPKGVPMITAACPKCKKLIEIHIPQPAAAPPEAAAPPPPPEAAAPPPPPEAAVPPPPPAAAPPPPAPAAAAPPRPSAPEPLPAPPPAHDDFVEDRKVAMVCFDDAGLRAAAKEGLEAAGYSVHLPEKSLDALHWLRRGKYEIVLIHQDFGGAPSGNVMLKTLQVMAMSMRRHMCIGLVGKALTTMDNMAAFSQSVNFVIAEGDLGKLKGICRQALVDNDRFYRIFREALQDAGKA